MKSGFAGSPTNPIFHFHLTFHFRQVFFEKDQRSSRCWSSLVVYEYIRACERNRPSPKHSTYSISYRWFFAPQFQTHTFPSQIFPLSTDFINSQHYLVSCANFYFSYFQKTKHFRLKRLSKPQYFFFLFFLFYILGFQPNVNYLLFLCILLSNT